MKSQRATNCASSNQKISLTKFTLLPHPIKVPTTGKYQLANFDLHVKLTEDMAHPIRVRILIKIYFY